MGYLAQVSISLTVIRLHKWRIQGPPALQRPAVRQLHRSTLNCPPPRLSVLWMFTITIGVLAFYIECKFVCHILVPIHILLNMHMHIHVHMHSHNPISYSHAYDSYYC